MWVHRQVQDAVYAGAELHTGGEPLTAPGFFYPPTVLSGAPDDALVHCGETRGPVATIRVADSFDETLQADRLGLVSVLTPLAVARPARLARAPGAHGLDQQRLPRGPRGRRARAARRRHPHQGRPSRLTPLGNDQGHLG